MFTLLRQLYARTWLTAEKQIVLFDYATAWLVQNKVLLPGPTVLERFIARLTERADQRLWARINRLVSKPQAEQLRSLLVVESGKRFSGLELLRRREEHASTRTINTAMHRLSAARTFGLGTLIWLACPWVASKRCLVMGRLPGRQPLTTWARNMA
ncbi:MAG: DUF4158 domain-containing protein [Chloroflexi bacterium]|nr:DUF4158 domain-containing protein [Chloroflexota bacterium]